MKALSTELPGKNEIGTVRPLGLDDAGMKDEIAVNSGPHGGAKVKS